MKTSSRSRRNGFTIIEMLISMTIAMILLIGAFYSTSETYAVVRQGDARLHTQVHARRTLERLAKDCRYANTLEVSGSESTGWTISMTTGLDDQVWVWRWVASTDELSVSDGELSETVVEDLTGFSIATEINSEGAISRITMRWTLMEQSGEEAGKSNINRQVELAASTWVRKAAG